MHITCEQVIVDQTQIPRYVSRFEPLLYVPVFTQKDFHCVHTGPPTKGNLYRGIYNYKLRVYNSSLQHNHLYSRGKVQSQNSITSTQEGKAQSQTTITFTQEGQGTKRKHNYNHLYTRGMNTNPKQKRDYNLGDHNRPQTTLSDHNRPQTIFLTKIRFYR